MKIEIRKWITVLIMATFVGVTSRGVALAEEGQSESDPGKHYGQVERPEGAPDQGLHRGREQGQGEGGQHRPNYEKLKRLKEENPEAFQQKMSERKAEIKEKLQELKEKDPEKFKEMKEQMIQRRREELKRLREENPEKFQEIMENRMQKLQGLKQSDPERYEELVKKHPRIADKMEDRADRREDRRDYREDRRDHREDVSDRREDRRDYREDRREESRGDESGGIGGRKRR